jgi:hypothetical protein
MKTNFLNLLWIGLIALTFASCSKDEKKDEPAPTPVNQLNFMGQSRTFSHAYLIWYTNELDIEGADYIARSLVLSTRDIAVFWQEASGEFDMTAIETYSEEGTSILKVDFASSSEQLNGMYNHVSNDATRILGASEIYFNFQPSISSFANTLMDIYEDVNSAMQITISGSVSESNPNLNVRAEGFIAFDPLTTLTTFDWSGNTTVLFTDIDLNE